jgi:hypothetical protein
MQVLENVDGSGLDQYLTGGRQVVVYPRSTRRAICNIRSQIGQPTGPPAGPVLFQPAIFDRIVLAIPSPLEKQSK